MLTWDYEAAATARAYVEGCGGEGPAGFIYGGSSPPLTAQDIVEILSVGRSYFQYPNACQSGQDGACELWRLVINRQATQAGCALKSCGGGEDVWSCRIGDGSRPPAPPY